jgi:hypothetical protein
MVRIEFLSPEQDLNPDNDNADVLLCMDDGTAFNLLVATPNNIYWCMDNESNDYYFGVPPLFVRTMTRDCVERALSALAKAPEWLAVYGTPTSASPVR